MIDLPGVTLRIRPAERFTASGASNDRVFDFARRFAKHRGDSALPACSIEVRRAPVDHVGLGSGTQLALAVAAGMNHLKNIPPGPAPDLADSVGRAARSAIGTHGFARGGLLVESGKHAGGVSPLACRCEVPGAWRFVLLRARNSLGISGERERQAFADLPPVPIDVTARLSKIALLELVPAAVEARFEEFSQALYAFGDLAGSLFATQQGGEFASPAALPLIEFARRSGVAGAGQSSWGPTVFALLPSAADADTFAAQALAKFEDAVEVIVAKANNHGAQLVLGSEKAVRRACE